MTRSERKILQLCIVTETYPPEINGVASTVRYWVEGLEQRGHGIHLIRPRQKGDGPARPACDETRLRRMGEGARATAEGMSWGRVVGDLEELLLEVIDRHRTEHRHETLAATTE
jgi:hypothetical protein